jgi:hypothetical protein
MGLFNRCAGDLTRFLLLALTIGTGRVHWQGGAAIRCYFGRRMLRHDIALMTTR